MNPSERWTSLEIDAADAPPMTPPESGRHVVVFLATPTVRSGGWSARAALEIARGWGAAGARIVLADLALEEPVLHGAAGMDNASLEGVSDALLFGTSFQRLGQPLSDGLYLVTAGTAVPDGEALRSHPRWRDFVDGFREADAVLALYLPSDAPGVDVLLSMADGVVVLCTEDEAEEFSFAGGAPLLAALGPERVKEEDRMLELDGAVGPGGTVEPAPALDDPGTPEGEPAVEDEESDAVADFLENMDVVPVDPETLVAAEAEAGEEEEGEFDDRELPEGRDPEAPAGESPELRDPMAEPVGDPLAGRDAAALVPDEIAVTEEGDEQVPDDPTPGEEATPETPTVPSFEEAAMAASSSTRKGRSGPRPALLFLLVLIVLAVLVAAFLGIVMIPGITPSATGVEEAGAAEVQLGAADVEAGAGQGPAEEAGALLSHVLAIGSFGDLETARQRVRAIELAAPTVRLVIAPVEVDGDPFFRLLAGPTATPDELEELRDRLVPALGGPVQGIPREARLAYLMGTAPRAALAERQRDVLSRLGIPAYVLRVTGADGEYRYRVYSGAYANPLEAGYLAAVLEENGIQGAPLTERRGVWPE